MKELLKGMLNDIGGEDLFDGILEILTKDPFTAYGVGGIVQSLYTMVVSVAMMLMFIYFLIGVVDKMTSENFTWEQLWKQMAMLLAAKLVIEHGLQIMQLMSQVGVEFVDLVMDQGMEYTMEGGLEDGTIETIIEGFEDRYSFAGLFKVIGDLVLFVYLLIPWLLSWIMGMAVKIICYTRLIEIYIRASFAPLALFRRVFARCYYFSNRSLVQYTFTPFHRQHQC